MAGLANAGGEIGGFWIKILHKKKYRFLHPLYQNFVLRKKHEA